MSCLVIKNDGIGDLILSSGIISRLAEYYAGKLDLVTCEQNREIAEMIGGVRQVFYVSRDDLKFSGSWGKYGILRSQVTDYDRSSLKRIQSSKYDDAICLRRFIRQNSLVIMRHVSATRKLCAWQYPTNAKFQQATRSSKGWHHYEGPRDVLWEPEYYQHFIYSTLHEKFDCSPRLQIAGLDNDACVIPNSIAIGVARSDQRWPSTYWVRLTQGLVESGYQIGLFGGADAVETCAQMAEFAGVLNYAGKFGFLDTAKELLRYSCYIGYDSSLSHFASLICSKVFVIYGGGTFRRFFPWPDHPNQHLIYHGMECFDCDWDCKYPQKACLLKIKTEAVVEFVKDVCAGKEIRELDLNPRNETYTVGWRKSESTVIRQIRSCTAGNL